MIKAIFFDFDQTIMDRDAAIDHFIHDQYERLFQSHPINKELFIQQFIKLDDNGYVWKDIVYEKLIREWALPYSVEQLVADYEENFKKFVVGFENYESILKELKKQGYLLGLITNGRVDFQRNNINQLNLESILDCIVVSDEVGMKKPNKEIFLYALDLLNVSSKEAIYVGDHIINDVQASKAVGMISVLKQDSIIKSLQADFTIHQLDELLDIVQTLRKNSVK